MSPSGKSVAAATGGMHRMKSSPSILAGCLLILGNSTVAAAAEEISDRGTLEEVVVTAQKRAQKLQEVPFAISAVTQQQLEQTGADGAEDYLSQVPGVFYTSQGRGQSNIVMRGISTSSAASNQQSTVEIYLDELPLLDRFAGWTKPDIDTFDIERVEVLRGPQGTLFGSNSLGGAIRLITAKPDLSQLEGRVELGTSTTDGGEGSNNFSGMLNVPLVEGEVGLRAVGYRRYKGGWVDNDFRDQQNVNDEKATGGRAILEFRPGDRATIQASAVYERSVTDDAPMTFDNEAAGPSDEFNVAFPSDIEADFQAFSLNVDYDFGGVSLTSSSVYGERDGLLGRGLIELALRGFGAVYDPDATLFARQKSERFAQELRLASSGEQPLKWIIGANYMDYHLDFSQRWTVRMPVVSASLTNFLNEVIEVDVRETAAFGEASYNITDKLIATVGARWTDIDYESDTTSTGTVINSPRAIVEKPASSVTPKISLSFFATPDTHIYATASKGFRGGQTNFNAAQNALIPAGFDPDTLWNYELGLKADWMDRRLTSNVALFAIEWSNIQLARLINLPPPSLVPVANIVDNAGDAKIRGAEAELIVRPIDSLEIGTSLTYTDAELESVLPGVSVIPGSRLPGTPEFSASNHVQVGSSFGDDMDGYVRLSHRYTSAVYSELPVSPTAPQLRSDEYHLLDLRVGITKGAYEVALYAENLTNSQDVVSRQTSFGTPFAYRLRPMTFGVTFRSSY